MRAEIQASQSSVPLPTSQSLSNAPGLSSSAQVPLVSMSPLLGIMPSTNMNTSNASQDFQSQMLTLLTETFSKLSNATTDKAEWPKFNGDSKKCRAWYLAVKAQVSLSPWLELFMILQKMILFRQP
jgi:hypothetical protein